MYENNKLGEEAEVIRIDNDMVDEGKRVSCWPKKINGAKNRVKGEELRSRREVSFESKNDEIYLACGDELELLQGWNFGMDVFLYQKKTTGKIKECWNRN